jgi:hypothetical protein
MNVQKKGNANRAFKGFKTQKKYLMPYGELKGISRFKIDPVNKTKSIISTSISDICTDATKNDFLLKILLSEKDIVEIKHKLSLKSMDARPILQTVVIIREHGITENWDIMSIVEMKNKINSFYQIIKDLVINLDPQREFLVISTVESKINHHDDLLVDIQPLIG